jgi:hypothetical protein
MTNCKSYVKSRGFFQNHDYRWVDEKNQLVEEPPAVTKIQDLIESESFSVVIARGNDKQNKEYLLLLITGIQPREREKERKDFWNRNILTSVAWICDNSEESEQYLRAIASDVLYIRSGVKDKISGYIENTDSCDSGFEVNFDALTLSKLAPEKIGNKEPELNQKLCKNLDETKEYLSKELKNSRLPTSQELKKEGLMSKNTALVVVTGIKSESAFKEAGIWRGLSNLVGGNNQMEEKSSKSWVFPLHFDYKIAIIVIVLCASLIINALQFNIIRQKNQEIQNLINQVERLGNQKQSLDELQDLQRPYKELGKKIQDLQGQYEELGKQFQKVLEKSNSISSL